MHELPEFVHTQSICLAVVFDGVKRTAPTPDARVGHRIAGPGGPEIQHNRLPSGDPLKAAGRNTAIRAPDILRDGHKCVVAGKRVVKTSLAPHLPESRIDVQIDATARGCE